jgi:hypothetical protein
LFKPDHCFQGWPGLGIGTIIVLVLIKLSPVPQQAEVYWRPFGEHLLRLASPLVFGIEWRDFLFEGVLLALIAYGAYKRSFKIPLEAKATGILFLLISLFAPHQAFTSAFIFTRIPVWLIMIYFASVELPLRRVSVVLTILILRSLDIGSRFLTMNPEIDQLKADLGQIPSGSLIYHSVAQGSSPLVPKGWNPSLLHANCLLILEKDVYISNLFTIEAQQPLIDQPGIGEPWRDHYFRVPFEPGVQREVDQLRQRLTSLPNENLRSRPAFLFVLKSESQSPPAVPEEPIITRPRYALYRIQ